MGHTGNRSAGWTLFDAGYVELYADVSRQVADAIDERAIRDENVSVTGPRRNHGGMDGPTTHIRTGGNRS
jgi:hypothetical protein